MNAIDQHSYIEQREYLTEIDTLRGVAITLTLVAHFSFMQTTPSEAYTYLTNNIVQFWGGVYLFFVISGYVISRSFLNGFSQQQARTKKTISEIRKKFYLRRFFRIMPTALTWIAITLFFGLRLNHFNSFGQTESILTQAIAASLFIYNAAMPWIGGSAFGIYWSLSFEEQFYLLFPFFGRLSSRTQILLLLILIATFGFVHRPADQTKLITSFPLDALAWGILIFVLQEQGIATKFEPKFLKTDLLKLASLLSSILVVILSPIVLREYNFGTGFMILPAAWLVFCSSFGKDYILSSGTLSSILKLIGRASFSLYCCHMPAFLLTREIVHSLESSYGLPRQSSNLVSLLFAIVLCFLFTYLSLRYIERPSRKYSRRFSIPVFSRTTSA